MSAACAVWEMWVELAKARGLNLWRIAGCVGVEQGEREGDCKGVERGADGGVVRSVGLSATGKKSAEN